MTATKDDFYHVGLTDDEVRKSRTEHGVNLLTPPKRPSLWKLYLEKFEDPVVRVLLVAAFFSLIISMVENEYAETIGIIAAILLATGIGFFFEYDANKKFDLLNAVNEETLVKVIRNGRVQEIPRKEVVVGDIIILETGEEIPADGELLEAISLQVNESNLTGEPVIAKTIVEADFDEEATYASNRVLRGTTVVDGHGMMRVEAVGDATEIGKVARQSTEQSTEPTPLNIPVTSCSIDILASNKTQYYVVRKGALIDVVPDITKNAIYTDAWATPEKFKLNKLTAEALIYPTVFGDGHESGISTLMGTESGFLLRFGDAGVEPNILQIATKAGNFAVSRAVNLNTWTHVAVTYDSEAKEIYVYFNGVEIDHFTGVDVGTVDWSPEHSNDNDGKPRSFWVGHSYNDNRWFEGRISEVRVWDKVLTKDEINTENHFYVLEEPENEENLILYWKLCDNQTNDVKDYSQYGNNGVFQKEATWVEVSLPATNE